MTAPGPSPALIESARATQRALRERNLCDRAPPTQPPGARPPGRHAGFSDAELLALLDSGLSQAQAAAALGVNPPAVSYRLKRIREGVR